MKFIFTGVTLLTLMFGALSSKAQQAAACSEDICTCLSDISPAGTMISHVHDKGEWMFAYRPMFMHMQGLTKSDAEYASNGLLSNYEATPKNMQMSMHMGMLMYGITNRLTAMVMFQYQTNYMEMSMQSGSSVHTHAMKSSGIGDTKLYAMFAVSKSEHRQVIASLGLSLPSGNIRESGAAYAMMYPNQRLPYAMQNGSGTVDLMPSFTYLINNSNFSYNAQVAAVFALNKNGLGYKYGNIFQTNFWVAKRLLSQVSASLRLQTQYSDKIIGSDAQLRPTIEPAANTANYGGLVIQTFAGLSYAPTIKYLRGQKFSAELGIPLLQRVQGIQMASKWQTLFNWSYSF